MEIIRAIFRKLGFNEALSFAVLSRMVGLVSGPVMLWMIAERFSEDVQGYYFTFGSVLALRTFLELGFSFSIAQIASHEFAKLGLNREKCLEGDARALSRYVSIVRLTFKWYFVAGLLTIIALGGGGAWFFHLQEDVGVDWVLPWWLLCGFSGLVMMLSGIGVVLTSADQVAYNMKFGFVVDLISTAGLLTAIVCGAGLYSVVIPPVIFAVAMVLATAYYWRGLFVQLWREKVVEAVNWKEEILPFQGRMAVTFMASYFGFYAFNPVVFHFHGAAVAGQMGMTILLLNVVSTIVAAWYNVRQPRFAILAARREYGELNPMFGRTYLQCLGFAILGVVCVLLGAEFVRWFEPTQNFGRRFGSNWAILFYGIGMLGFVSISCQGAYLRAHKKEPFMWLVVGQGILTSLLLLLLVPTFAVEGGAFAHMIGAGLAGVVATFIYRVWRDRFTSGEVVLEESSGESVGEDSSGDESEDDEDRDHKPIV